MSPLTKVFVVLLVVLSLLNVAGEVVFVNKIVPMKAQVDTAVTQAQTAQQQKQIVEDQNKTLQAHIAELEANANTAKQASEGVINTLNSDKATLSTQVAQLTLEKANLTTAMEKQNEEMNWLSQTLAKATQEIKDLRTANDTLVARSEENSRQISNLTNQSETVTAQYNNTREQLQLAQNNIDKYRQALKDHNVDPDGVIGGFVPTGAGTPPINGTVKEVKAMNGSTYVTIDVGSADSVLKGMKFSVLDAQGNFLCFAYIQEVDNNYSIGKLDGQQDKVSQVQVSDLVKTQIRGS